MIIGIDPGKSGGFCAMAESGKILSVDKMPVDEGGISAIGVARLYRKYQSLADFDEMVNVYIEKIFTKPTDALPQKTLKAVSLLQNRLTAYFDAMDGQFASQDHLDALRAQFELLKGETKGVDIGAIRVDGRVGMLNYAKGAGILQMAALLGWPICEVMPRTWMKVIKNGAPGSMNPKEQSIYVAKGLWPELVAAGHKDGPIEACLIAEYGRRQLARAAS